MLPCKKIYCDTRYMTKDSASTSQFKIELPQTIYMPPNTIFHIDDISIPHAWTTIIAGFNDKLYFRAYAAGINNDYIIKLEPKNYTINTLAEEIKTKMNAEYPAYESFYDISQHNITIRTNGVRWQFLTDAELSTRVNDTWNGATYNIYNPCSANEILGNTNLTSKENSVLSDFISEYVDLQPIRNMFISSPN